MIPTEILHDHKSAYKKSKKKKYEKTLKLKEEIEGFFSKKVIYIKRKLDKDREKQLAKNGNDIYFGTKPIVMLG